MKRCINCMKVFGDYGWTCPGCGWRPQEISGFSSFVPENAEDLLNYPRDVFKHLYELEENSFWFRNRNKLIFQVLTKYFPAASNLLEIGCGTGFVLAAIAAHNPDIHLVGSDLYHEALRCAHSRLPGVPLLQIEAGNIPYQEEFDLICVLDVLEHIDCDTEALKQIHQALKRGGGLIITVPQHPWLWSRTDNEAGHRRRYTKQNLSRKVTDSGFRIVMISSFISFLLPVLILSRLATCLNLQKDSALPQQGELSLPHALDVIFETICSGENWLIGHNLALPIGGSLICIATRR